MHSEFNARLPKGSVLYRTPQLAIGRLQPLALKLLGAVQAFSPAPQKIEIIEDWLDHDGLQFAKGVQPLEFLFAVASTPRSLFEGTPKDDSVYLRAEAEDGSWILRVLTDWDDDDREQVGELQLVVAAKFAAQIEAAFQDELRDGSLHRTKPKANQSLQPTAPSGRG